MLENILFKMKKASYKLANVSTDIKNKALARIALNLERRAADIITQNEIDLHNAEKDKLAPPLLKRLKFDQQKIMDVVKGINDLISLEDPANKVLSKLLLDDGLILSKISVPIGVIGVIFESRPDALVQIAALCIKSGNCSILKGGIEAINTNKILTRIILDSISEVSDKFDNTIFLAESREDVTRMLKYNQYINLIIPRGSNEFVQYIQQNTSIPVLGHADGICHLYIDDKADINKAVEITVDSKTQYVAVCNALETLLVHQDIAATFLPRLQQALEGKVLLKGCEKTRQILSGIEIATEEDWKTEYLDYILSIKVIDSIETAIIHINQYGSGHTDAIVTNDENNKKIFKAQVDSAAVMVNCSTRFSDGYRFGFGAEVGISTNKIHARGPVGLDGLMIYKYILEGEGQLVNNYCGSNCRSFKHEKLPVNGK